MSQEISEGRKAGYFIGNVLTALGVLSFLSTFFSAAMHFGDFSNFDSQVRSSMFRAIGGMVLIGIGQVIRGISARGVAGSGLILDPEQAREDLEPYARMGGGLLHDALDESGLKPNVHGGASAQPQRVVMIKCPRCHKLNEEDSKFCQECGHQF